MSEFEEWNNSHKAYAPLLEMTMKTERAKAWKAALDWAVEKLENDVNGYFKIKEELHNFD